MYQCITTVFRGPTDSSNARLTVRADAGRITVEWDSRVGVPENHKAAAEALARKLKWNGRWSGGSLPGNSGYAFVRVIDDRDGDDRDSFTIPRDPSPGA